MKIFNNNNKKECLINTVDTIRPDWSFIKITKYTKYYSAMVIRLSEEFLNGGGVGCGAAAYKGSCYFFPKVLWPAG